MRNSRKKPGCFDVFQLFLTTVDSKADENFLTMQKIMLSWKLPCNVGSLKNAPYNLKAEVQEFQNSSRCRIWVQRTATKSAPYCSEVPLHSEEFFKICTEILLCEEFPKKESAAVKTRLITLWGSKFCETQEISVPHNDSPACFGGFASHNFNHTY